MNESLAHQSIRKIVPTYKSEITSLVKGSKTEQAGLASFRDFSFLANLLETSTQLMSRYIQTAVP